MESIEIIDRLADENPQDVHWRIEQARLYERIGLLETRDLYDNLESQIDLDHPDEAARERWTRFAAELKANRDRLRPA